MKTSLLLEPIKPLPDDVVDTAELLESLQEEVECYDKLGIKEELLQQEVVMQLIDANGHILSGRATLPVGWLEGGSFLITGSLEKIIEEKHVLKK